MIKERAKLKSNFLWLQLQHKESLGAINNRCLRSQRKINFTVERSESSKVSNEAGIEKINYELNYATATSTKLMK